jgi:hypothetical protein
LIKPTQEAKSQTPTFEKKFTKVKRKREDVEMTIEDLISHLNKLYEISFKPDRKPKPTDFERVVEIKMNHESKKLGDFSASVVYLNDDKTIEISMTEVNTPYKLALFLSLITNDHNKEFLIKIIQAWFSNFYNYDFYQTIKAKSVWSEGSCPIPEKYYPNARNKTLYNLETFTGIMKNPEDPKLFAYFFYKKNKIYCYLEDFKNGLTDEEKKKIDSMNLEIEETDKSTIYLFLVGRGKPIREINQIVTKLSSECESKCGLYKALKALDIECLRKKFTGTYDQQIEKINSQIKGYRLVKLINYFRIDFLNDILSITEGHYIIIYCRLFSTSDLHCVAIKNKKIVWDSENAFNIAKHKRELVLYMILYIKNI